MGEQEIETITKAILSKFARNQESLQKLNGETRLREELDISSINLVDILMELEEKFNIEIEDVEIFEVVTLQDCVRLVHSKKTGPVPDAAATA